MKIKSIKKDWWDYSESVNRELNEEFEVTAERGKQIIEAGFGEEVKPKTDETKPKTAPKKTTTKK